MTASDTPTAQRDISTLAWVHDELQHALEQAHRSLLRAQRERIDHPGQALSGTALTALAHAAGLTHQVGGALIVLDLVAPARHAEATEAALRHLLQYPAALTAEALDTVARALFSHQDYLRRLLAHQPVGELALWPSYQALTQLAANPRSHPADLAALPPAAALPLVEAPPLHEGSAARTVMERELLAGLRGDAAALRKLTALCLGLAAGARDDARVLWQWAAAFFDGQAAGRIVPDEHSRRIGSRLLARLRGSASADPSALLLRDLQFFCATARPDGGPAPILTQTLSLGGLPAVITDPERLPALGRIDPSWIPQARRRARALHDTWAAVTGGDVGANGLLAEHLAGWSESARQLLPQGDALAAAMDAAVTVHGERPSPELAMEVATTLLCVEAALEDMSFDQRGRAAQFATLAARLTVAAGGETPGPIEPWMEQLYRDASERQTMGSVTQELRAHLAEVEQRLDRVSRQPADRSPLADVPARLAAMRGVFTVLDMGQAAQAVLRMRDDVDDAIRGATDADADARMAHNVSALSLLIDLLAVQPAVAKKLFRFDAVSGRISALMGHVPAAARLAAQQAPSPVPEPPAVVDADAELRQVFFEEARGVLAEGQTALVRLRTRPSDAVALGEMRRAFHTLKGSSAMVGMQTISDAAWACEAVCNVRLEAEPVQAEPALLALAEDALVAFAKAIERPGTTATDAALANLLAQAQQVLAPTPAAESDGALDLTLDLNLQPTTVIDWAATQAVSLSGGRSVAAPADEALSAPPPADLDTGGVDFELDFDTLLTPPPAAPAPEAAPETAPEPVLEPEPELLEDAVPAPVPEPEPLPEPEPELMGRGAEPMRHVGDLRIPIKLFNIFLNEADEQSRRLGTVLAEWVMQPTQPVDGEAERLAHTLGGEAATVGFAPLAEAARWLEKALVAVAAGTTPQAAALLPEVAEAQRRLLHQFAAGFVHPVPPELAARMAAWVAQPPPPKVVPLRAAAVPTAAAPTPLPAEDDLERSPLDALAEPLMAQDALDATLWPVFVPEAQDLLTTMAHHLRQWEDQPSATEPAHAMLRALHTFKGGARLAGAMALGEWAHRLESVVEQGLRRDEPARLAPLQQGVDRLAEAFERLQAGDGTTAPGATEAAQTPRRGVRVHARLLDRMVAQAGEVGVARTHLEAELTRMREGVAELSGNLERLRGQLRELDIQLEAQMISRTPAAPGSHDEGFDPLEMDRFTRAQELTRMLVESVEDVGTVQRGLREAILASEDQLVQQGRLTRGLQDDLLRARMLEFDTLSERLYRVVRQAAKESGKQVRLHLEGGHVEIDRGVLDRMAPAFEHLLRNAVVHGIERSALRESLHKDPVGTIEVRLRPSGNEVLIEVQDDGGGLDLARIAERARQNGWLAGDARPTEAELTQLIFRPGFSTVSEVSELAGRGVGMDVVRTEVAALGGRVDVTSTGGQGTRLQLVLPLSTAITQVVPVRSGRWQLALPAMLIEQVVQVPAVLYEATRRDHQLAVDGTLLPLWPLATLLGDAPPPLPGEGAQTTVLVVRSADQRVALQVDAALPREEVVVKNLGPQLARLPALSGVYLRPDGRAVPIYHPLALAGLYGEAAHRAAAAGERAPGAADDGDRSPAPVVLVVDDSLTVRRVTQRLLEREGWRAVLARDGEDALAQLAALTAQGQPPVAVLSDIEMPRMDGFELLRTLRADAATAGLPVVMITSRIAERHREQAMALGASAYLGKPYQESELLALVKEYAARS
ncbi:MAG: Hpt domain-containing protein [Proteobacteria bacterium]|nr:Hpt domain-containing protein [Pseudomonadota bacterium]